MARSSGSVSSDTQSAPMSRTRRAAPALTRAVRGDQPVDETGARRVDVERPTRQPRAWWTAAEVAGTARSGVQVARTSRSTWPGASAARSRARRPASVASDDTVPPMRRSRMPERVDDPLVGGVEARLELGVGDDVVGQGGAPAGDDSARGPHAAVGLHAQPGHGLARRDAFAAVGQEAHDLPAKGVRTSTVPTVPRRSPTATGAPSPRGDVGAVGGASAARPGRGQAGDGLEDAGRRAR